MKIVSSISIVGLALLFGGCAHTARERVPAPTMAVLQAPIDPALSANAAQVATKPTGSEYVAQPVYNMPKVRRINLEPYVDEQGNSYGPQVKYVLETPGGWNMDALRNPSKAFVPQVMSPQMSAPAAATTISSGETVVQQPVKGLRELYNIKDVVVTGFVERGQEPLANEMAAKSNGAVPLFDENLGWILVPPAALNPTNFAR